MGTDQVEGFVEPAPTPATADDACSVPIAAYQLHCRQLRCCWRGECDGGVAGAEQRGMQGHCPVARHGHSLTEIEPDMLFLFGGVSRSGECLNDVWVLQLTEAEVGFTQLRATGDVPCGRFGHTAHRMLNGSGVIIFGGSDDTTWFGDLYVVSTIELVDLQSVGFRRVDACTAPPTVHDVSLPSASDTAPVPTRSSWPSARRSHTLTPTADGEAVLFGGHSVISVNDVWLLDERTFEWRRVETRGTDPHDPIADTPVSRYCHTAVVYPAPSLHRDNDSSRGAGVRRCLYVFGGCLFSPMGDNVLWELNLATFVWR
ncbi:kelch repeat protein, partial [Trypanosoma grayi]|uniref:kelch repeat protein n=1 Tax=Trypanosoma grayi TaxID=71804 RepID=UPI0004F41E39